MTAWVVVLVLAAAGSTEVEGALTVGGVIQRRPQAAGVDAIVHGQLDVSRSFGRFFVEARGSLLVRGGGLQSAVSFSDLGSRLALGYRPTGFVQRVSLEVMPFNPLLRLPSFDWANAWSRPITETLTPVLTAELVTQAGTLWLSGRFKQVRNPLTLFNELTVDPIVGLELPLPSGLKLEARFGWFSHSLNPGLGSLGVSLPLQGGGGGTRLSWTWNEPVGPALDLITYRGDPLRFERFFVSEPRRTRLAAQLSLEGGAGGQQLADPETFGKGKTQLMAWADLQARVRLRELRLFATARVQSVTFSLFDAHGVPPFTALSSSVKETAPLVAGFLGADWMIRALRLTPGLLLRATQYGWLRFPVLASGGNNPIPGQGGSRTVLVGPRFWFISLRDTVAPFIAAKVSARWEVLSFASVVAELDVEKDLNDYSSPEPGLDGNLFPQTDQLTVTGQLFLQARF